MYPRRFKTNHVPIDWPRLIDHINCAGWTQAEIAEAVGYKTPKMLAMIARESYPHNPAWDEAFALLELFFQATDQGGDTKPIPPRLYNDFKTKKIA